MIMCFPSHTQPVFLFLHDCGFLRIDLLDFGGRAATLRLMSAGCLARPVAMQAWTPRVASFRCNKPASAEASLGLRPRLIGGCPLARDHQSDCRATLQSLDCPSSEFLRNGIERSIAAVTRDSIELVEHRFMEAFADAVIRYVIGGALFV